MTTDDELIDAMLVAMYDDGCPGAVDSMRAVLAVVRGNDPMVAGLRWHVEALDRACRMALEALTLVTDAGDDEAEKWSVSGGAYEGVKCVAAINAIRAAIPMPHEELADGWCVPKVKGES